MEGLGREDGIDGGIPERDLFGASGAHLGFGGHRHEQVAHRLGRLDGNHPAEPGDEQARELSRTRGELEHGRR